MNEPRSHTGPPKVVIIGGGFGGVMAARWLRSAPVETVLVDRANHHLFQPLLYQVATGVLTPPDIAPPLREIVRGPRSTVTLAEATGVDLHDKRVEVCGADGITRTIPYDHLVVAAGSRTSYFGHDAWARNALPMKTLADAAGLRDRILAAYERAAEAGDPDEERRWTTFVIVGGGPTGIELAGQLATVARALHREFRRIDTAQARVVVVEAGSEILAAFSAPLRQHARRVLEGMGVDIRVDTSAAGVDDHGVDLRAADGSTSRLEAGTVVWAAGVEASPLAAQLADGSGAGVDHKGRVKVEPDCSLPGHPEVFAIGDLADLDHLPGLAEPAMQEGLFVGRVLRARATGRAAPASFRYHDLGTMAAVSPTDAIAQVRGLHLTGAAGKAAWGAVHLAFLATWGRRASVFGHWAYAFATRRLPAQAILQTVDAQGLAATSPRRPAHPPAPAHTHT